MTLNWCQAVTERTGNQRYIDIVNLASAASAAAASLWRVAGGNAAGAIAAGATGSRIAVEGPGRPGEREVVTPLQPSGGL
jgi:hypothetical protein